MVGMAAGLFQLGARHAGINEPRVGNDFRAHGFGLDRGVRFHIERELAVDRVDFSFRHRAGFESEITIDGVDFDASKIGVGETDVAVDGGGAGRAKRRFANREVAVDGFKRGPVCQHVVKVGVGVDGVDFQRFEHALVGQHDLQGDIWIFAVEQAEFCLRFGRNDKFCFFKPDVDGVFPFGADDARIL